MKKTGNNIPSLLKSNLKKKYEKPCITSEKVFETAALACGKCIRYNPIFQGGCMGVPRLS